jgi:1-deoxy-D-xylulose-5-phosphate reductoisomerase
MTAVMSAANEKAVEVFLREEIAYLDIVPLVSACCEAHKADLTAAPSIDDIVHFDAWARDWTAAHAKTFNSHKTLTVA